MASQNQVAVRAGTSHRQSYAVTGNGHNPQKKTPVDKSTTYALKKDKALDKKLKATNRKHPITTEITGGGIRLYLQAGLYELVRRILPSVYEEHYPGNVEKSRQVDKTGNVVHETVRLQSQGNAVYTINLYHTSSSLLVNGKDQAQFLERDLPKILRSSDEAAKATGMTIRSLNTYVKRVIADCREELSRLGGKCNTIAPDNRHQENIPPEDSIPEDNTRCTVCRKHCNTRAIFCTMGGHWIHYRCDRMSKPEIEAAEGNNSDDYICKACQNITDTLEPGDANIDPKDLNISLEEVDTNSTSSWGPEQAEDTNKQVVTVKEIITANDKHHHTVAAPHTSGHTRHMPITGSGKSLGHKNNAHNSMRLPAICDVTDNQIKEITQDHNIAYPPNTTTQIVKRDQVAIIQMAEESSDYDEKGEESARPKTAAAMQLASTSIERSEVPTQKCLEYRMVQQRNAANSEQIDNPPLGSNKWCKMQVPNQDQYKLPDPQKVTRPQSSNVRQITSGNEGTQFAQEKEEILAKRENELKTKEKNLTGRERLLKQQEREVKEQGQHIASLKSMVLGLEQQMKDLREENRLLKLETLRKEGISTQRSPDTAYQTNVHIPAPQNTNGEMGRTTQTCPNAPHAQQDGNNPGHAWHGCHRSTAPNLGHTCQRVSAGQTCSPINCCSQRCSDATRETAKQQGAADTNQLTLLLLLRTYEKIVELDARSKIVNCGNEPPRRTNWWNMSQNAEALCTDPYARAHCTETQAHTGRQNITATNMLHRNVENGGEVRAKTANTSQKPLVDAPPHVSILVDYHHGLSKMNTAKQARKGGKWKHKSRQKGSESLNWRQREENPEPLITVISSTKSTEETVYNQESPKAKTPESQETDHTLNQGIKVDQRNMATFLDHSLNSHRRR